MDHVVIVRVRGERIIEKCNKCSWFKDILQEKRSLNVKITPGTRSGETYIFPEVCSDHPAFEKPWVTPILLLQKTPRMKHFKVLSNVLGDKFHNILKQLYRLLFG